MTELNKSDIADMLEETFDSILLCQYIVEQDLSKLTELINDKLHQNGFPQEADYLNVNWTIDCSSKIIFSEWSEIAIANYIPELDIDSISSFFSSKNDLNMYYNNLNNIDIVINIVDDVELWKLEHLDEEVDLTLIANSLASKWEFHREQLIASLMENIPENIVQDYKEHLLQEGFSSEANINNTKFKIDIINNLDLLTWSNFIVNTYGITDINNLIMSDKIVDIYLKSLDSFKIFITCLDDPFEWNEDNM